MREFYVLQNVIDIIQRKCKDSDVRKQVEKNLGYRHVSLHDFRNILTGDMPYQIISKDLVIVVYDVLSNICNDVRPKSDYFEDIEIKNADAYSKLYQQKELLRILTNKGVKINTERKAAFIIDEYIVKYSDKRTTNDIINKFAQISSTEGNLGKDLCDFTRSDLVELFANYSTNAFNVYKNIIQKYIQWCYENGYTSEDRIIYIQELSPKEIDNLAIYKEQYFASVKQILNLLDHIESSDVNSKQIPEYAWNNIIYPAVFLSWLGFDAEEIVEIRVNNIDEKNNEIWLPLTGKRISNIDQFIMDSIASAKKLSVMSNVEFLLFSEGRASTDQPLSINLVSQRMSQINKIAEELNIAKNFGTKKIRLSGSYARMYDYEVYNNRELNTSDFNLISMLCRQEIDRSRVNIVLKDYAKWKQALSSEQV